MIHSFFCEKAHSRWLILLIDQLIVVWSLGMSFLMTSNLQYFSMLNVSYLSYILLYFFVAAPVFMLKKIHTGIIRYSNTEDILRIFIVTLLSNLLFWLIIQLTRGAGIDTRVPHLAEATILNFFISSTLLIMLRLGVKSIFNTLKSEGITQEKSILIYGSDHFSVLIKHAFENHTEFKYNVLGFVDDNTDRVGKYIQQKQVYPSSALPNLKARYHVDDLVVSGSHLSKKDSALMVLEKCIELGIKVLTVPPSDQWLNGQLNLREVKDLKIEDLLQREPIVLMKKNISRQLFGKRILITGAAGSIGSEIVRQVYGYNPQLVVLCDQAETPLHDLQLELEDNGMAQHVRICIANIQNQRTMRAIFELYRPEVVFHAAAYKHVPMMENNPRQAILDNVLGTKNLADLSVEFGVEKFIMISTDKAVNPTNVMGASKRLAEIYTQSLNNQLNNNPVIGEPFKDAEFYLHSPEAGCKTRFITTRFGNVLGSNGSVIPRFQAQIRRGGPVTVTHPEITRYFMTIPEAVQLVLEAAAMGRGGEIFIFDMGEPVKIADLAINMIKLSGLVPGKDIRIEFTGLRPGEKLYEELLNKEELTIPTHHEKIKISSVIIYPYEYVQEKINELLRLNDQASENDIVRKIKEIIPEYKSNNSRFEDLDTSVEVLMDQLPD